MNFLGKTLTALLLTCAAAHISAAAEQQLNMGGSTNTSGFYPYYTAIANSVSNANEDINVTVVSLGGFVKNDKAMRKGEMDFGGTSADILADAEADGFDKYRVLWWAVPSFQNVMVRKDSGIKTMADLEGKCFNVGVPGSAASRLMINSLKAIGVQPEIQLSDSKSAINSIRDGRCLGQIKTMGGKTLDAASAALNVTTPLWPIGWTAEEKAKVKEAAPWVSFGTVKEGIVDGAPAYDVSVGWIGFAATSDMDAETGYKIVKSMWENIDDQAAAFKGVAGRNIPQITLETSAAPLHAGAVRYYREIGLDVPAHLVPAEMK